MDFHDQIVLICGVVDDFALRIAESTSLRGAHAVALVGEAGGSTRVHQRGDGELIWVPDAALGEIRDTVDSIRRLGRIDVVINLVPVTDTQSGRASAADHSDIAVACEAVVRRTCRVVDATRDLLQESRPNGAIVNVGYWESSANIRMPAAVLAAFGSLRTVTHSLAKQLAPQIRVNAVLSESAAAPNQDHGVSLTEWHPPPHGEEDVGPALFLASSAARHMTGTILTSDAGRRLGFATLSRPQKREVKHATQ